VTALGFPGAAYDRWKTTPPERSDCCAGCGGQMRVDRRDPDSHPYAVVDGELLCSYGCECVYLATQASEPRQVMQHVADALGADLEVRVHAWLAGGGREARGPVVDWSVDGTVLTVANEASGQDCTVRADNVRRVEVLR
jgi:hypothetical protein